MALTLVILAGGLGSRFGGLKQMVGIGPAGETLLEYALYDARQSGFEHFVMIVRQGMEDDVRATILARLPVGFDVELVPQRPDDLPGGAEPPGDRVKPLGTAHAVWAARKAVTSPFAVINADDFYGRDGYEQIARFFTESGAADARFVLAGYELAGTLSPHGPVSRGVCEVGSDGQLQGLTEHTAVERGTDGKIRAKAGGTLADDTPVSLNLFGFTPAVFPILEEGLRTFLREKGGDPAAECYLPTVIESSIRRSEATVEVRPTSAFWFGITYPEDRPLVSEALRKQHESGVYPTPLWSGPR